MGVAIGGEISFRLVQQDVSLGGGAEGLAVQGDAIVVEIDPVVGVADDSAVDADAAGADPTSRIGTGAGTGF